MKALVAILEACEINKISIAGFGQKLEVRSLLASRESSPWFPLPDEDTSGYLFY